MIERLGLATLPDLEAALLDLGTAVELPPTPDLAASVGQRLRERPIALPAGRPILRSIPRSLLLAAAIALLLVGAVIGVQVGLRLLSIEFGPVPSASPTQPGAPGPRRAPGSGLGLGEATTLDEARGQVSFPIVTPPNLGPPAAVFVGGPALRGQVALVYPAGPELPPAESLGGAGLLITENEGSPDEGLAHKLIDAHIATVEAVTVDGAPGYWISGDLHFFWYLDPDGAAIEDSRRLVGDTLVWERDGVLYRVEGEISKAEALAIAESMR